MPIRDFSDGDMAALRMVISREVNRVIHTRRTWTPEDDPQAPETYICRTPSTGIPALTEAPGAPINDDPGTAVCGIYQLVPNSPAFTGTGTGAARGTLLPISLNQRVYNLSPEPVPANVWRLITRDKFGRWIVPSYEPPAASSGTVIHGTCNGRLGTGDAEGEEYDHGSTGSLRLYYHAVNGNQIGLYTGSGSSWDIRNINTGTPVSILNTGLSADQNYDVWAFWNSTLVDLELTAWTSGTVRATNLVYQNGVLVKGTDRTRRYIGTIRTNASSQFIDTHQKRFVWNAYNRARKHMAKTEETASWNASTSFPAAWRAGNNSTSNRLEFVLGYPGDGHKIPEMVTASVRCWASCTGSSEANATVGIGLDSTTNPWGSGGAAGGVNYHINGFTAHPAMKALLTADAGGYPTAPGYHFLQWIEKAVPLGVTVTFHGYESSDFYGHAGIFGEIWC